MENKRILELLKNERECIQRNNDGKCDRKCLYCDLFQEDDDLLELYDSLIGMVNAKEMRKSESFCRNCGREVKWE